MAPKDTVYAVNDEEVESSASAALEFGDANLRAIAEVYNNEGDEEFRKKEYVNAIHFYTEGIKVSCNNKELNAKLYSNRATVHQFLGNYNDALRDAKASRELQPSCMKAFTAGAQACMKMNLFEKAIAWIDDGLAIDGENQTLLELKKESITKQCKLLETNRGKTESLQTEGANYQSTMAFSPLNLDIAKKVGNRKKEGLQYLKLGNGFFELSHFQEAIDNYQRYLCICKEQRDRAGEGNVYGRLGNAFNSVGKVKEAMKYHELQLIIAAEVGDKMEEGRALSSLGNLWHCLGDFEKAKEYHELHLAIAMELGDTSEEGYAYGNLGNTLHKLGLCTEALEYHKKNLTRVLELGDRVGEEKAYGNIGLVLRSLGDTKRAMAYHEQQLSIANEEGMIADEACANYELGCSLESLGSEIEALEYYKLSARLFEEIRADLPCKQTNCFKDEWKINLFDEYQCVYTALCRIYLNLGMILEALSATENGRSQALLDFLGSHYGMNSGQILSCEKGESMADILKYISLNTIVLGIDDNNINIWLLQPGQGIEFRRNSIEGTGTDLTYFFREMVGGRGTCEVSQAREHIKPNWRIFEEYDEDEEKISWLRGLYDFCLGPIENLLQGDELIIVPEGPLCLVPFAALKDPVGRYMCESYKIRIAPSLTSLKLTADSPQGYHSDSGALLVGDPEIPKFIYRGRMIRFGPLPFAREEVEMIGRLIDIKPLTGKEATKMVVLEQLTSVALVHIATHGDAERGEVALAPNPTRSCQVLKEEDCILRMDEVLNVNLRAKLVVLSCCHSGCGAIMAEGVVGMARAFLAAGARSVLASMWAIDDEATFEFMKSFYQHLMKGNNASEALNKAMKCLRESEKFSDFSKWASFVLIGDDVTLEFLHRPYTVAETKVVEEHAPDDP